MSSKKLKGFLSTVLGVFSTLTAAAGLTQVNPRLAVAILVVSGVCALASAVLFFIARNHSGLGQLIGIVEPMYKTRRAEEEDLKAVAELDRETYGSDSVDYEGLSAWWGRYRRGVTLLLEDSEIIGAVGIWPVTKEVYERIVAGAVEESAIEGAGVCDENDPAPRAYWYFGDIILLAKYQNSMKNFAGRLLMAAVEDWVVNGDLADELHLCAIAVGPRPAWWSKVPVLRTALGALKRASARGAGALGRGEKALLRFGFERKGLSPSGQPVYSRTLPKRQLLEDVDKRIRRSVKGALERAEKRLAAPEPTPGATFGPAAPPRRWQWVPAVAATAAASLLLTVVVVRQLTPRADAGHGVAGKYLDAPQELARQTAEVLKIGLRDHTHCAIDAWDGSPADERQMAEALGDKYAPLVGVVRNSLAGAYEVAAAHRCAAGGRDFVHLILRRQNALVSVAVTKRGEDRFPQQGPAAERIVADIPLYRSNLKTFEVDGFAAEDYLIFVVSNLGREENMGVAESIAPAVRKYLLKLED